MDNKVLAFDMDGTILLSDHVTFNPSAIEAIKNIKKDGHKIMIATGRALSMVKPLLKMGNIEDVFDYITCSNGSYTYDVANDKIITYKQIPKEDAKLFYRDGKKTGSVFCAHNSEGVFLCTQTGEVGRENNDLLEGDTTYATEEKLHAFIDNHTIVQASIKNHDYAIIEMAKDIEKFVDSDCRVSNAAWMDLNPLGVSKISALEFIAEKVGIPIERFIAFGDAGNDIQMLKGAGIGVAMGNGSDDAKSVADVVIGHCDSDAIATYIKQVFEK